VSEDSLNLSEELPRRIIQDSLQVVKVASRLVNPELLERVTSLKEQVLELSSTSVELLERVFQLEKDLEEANERLYLIG
jgi:predicted nuclease with TOPRIM domain